MEQTTDLSQCLLGNIQFIESTRNSRLRKFSLVPDKLKYLKKKKKKVTEAPHYHLPNNIPQTKNGWESSVRFPVAKDAIPKTMPTQKFTSYRLSAYPSQK